MTRRAASYIRESTEEQQEGWSPDAQRERIQKYASANDLDLVAEYVEFQSAWRDSEKRPEFQRLIRDAAAGLFEVILVFHSSRFARDQVVAVKYKRMLREKGIAVV